MLTFHNKQYSLQVQVVKLRQGEDPPIAWPIWKTIAEGATVTFPIVFKNIPQVVIVTPLGETSDSEVQWTAVNVTTSGCVIELVGSNGGDLHESALPADIDFEIVIAAFERP